MFKQIGQALDIVSRVFNALDEVTQPMEREAATFNSEHKSEHEAKALERELKSLENAQKLAETRDKIAKLKANSPQS